MVADPEGLTPLIRQPTVGHDPPPPILNISVLLLYAHFQLGLLQITLNVQRH